MKRVSFLLAILAASCASKEEREVQQDIATPTKKDANETKVKVDRVSLQAGEPSTVAFEMTRPPVMPSRLKRAFDNNRNWLHLRDPRRYSFAAGDILTGKTLFLPSSSGMTYAQENRERDLPLPGPVLVRFEGTIDSDALKPHIRAVKNPGLTPEGLGVIEDTDLRVMLGRGVDLLMATQSADPLDVHVWVAVVDKSGKPVEWRSRLIDAYRSRSVIELRPLNVVIMRRRSATLPRYFRLELEHVVIGAQMVLKPSATKTAWIWEGVWFGRMDKAPTEIVDPDWPDLPLPNVVYKEFKRPKGTLSGFWPALMKPLALGAEVGTAFIDGDPVFDRYAKEAIPR